MVQIVNKSASGSPFWGCPVARGIVFIRLFYFADGRAIRSIKISLIQIQKARIKIALQSFSHRNCFCPALPTAALGSANLPKPAAQLCRIAPNCPNRRISAQSWAVQGVFIHCCCFLCIVLN
jgi:hypothetical protein